MILQESKETGELNRNFTEVQDGETPMKLKDGDKGDPSLTKTIISMKSMMKTLKDGDIERLFN